jgi:hypothetical protein
MLKPMLTDQISVTIAALLALAVTAFTSSNAFADTCNDVCIVLINNDIAGKVIKATKFEYKDGSKWKTENLLGLDGHQKIEPHDAAGFDRNLQGIGGERTQFKVTYKSESWLAEGPRWGDEVVETTDTFTCHDHGYYFVELPEPLSLY